MLVLTLVSGNGLGSRSLHLYALSYALCRKCEEAIYSDSANPASDCGGGAGRFTVVACIKGKFSTEITRYAKLSTEAAAVTGAPGAI